MLTNSAIRRAFHGHTFRHLSFRRGLRHEQLVLFLPMLLLPAVAAARDLVLLIGLFALVVAVEAASSRSAAPTSGAALGWAVGMLAVAAVGLGVGLGAALALALYLSVRTTEAFVPEHLWPVPIGLGALGATLLLDLALVALGLERSSFWLALAAAIGSAAAVARQGCHSPAAAPVARLEAAAGAAARRTWSELVLIGSLCLVLALWAALHAHDPALRQVAGTAPLLALPLLAAALVRLGWQGLRPALRPGTDPLAVLLLAAWATAGVLLGGG